MTNETNPRGTSMAIDVKTLRDALKNIALLDSKFQSIHAAQLIANDALRASVTEAVEPVVEGARKESGIFVQPNWGHVGQAFVDGAREARQNPDADEEMFKLAADGYTKRLFEQLDPESERLLRTNSYAAHPSPALPVDKQEPTSWQEALWISNLSAVDEALQNFSHDSTEDNAVGLIQTVLDAVPPAPPSGSELPPLPEGMPKTEGMMWNQIQFASDMVTKYGKASEEKVMLKKEWERECADGDKIIEALGMTIEEGRTEGGSLHIARIKNRIKELAARSMPAGSVSDEDIYGLLNELHAIAGDCHNGDYGLPLHKESYIKSMTAAVHDLLARALLAGSSHAPEEVDYELRQDGMTVAATSGSGALKEIQHYAAQYQQDGPIEIYEVTRRKIAASPDLAQKGTIDGN